jgi:hypothetical protein
MPTAPAGKTTASRVSSSVRLFIVKVREVYSNYLMVAGVICLVMGIGNWTVGVIESSKFQALLYKTARTGLEESYRNFQQLDHQKNEEVLRRINEDREKYNGARV